jgi:ABC-type uncharacterized transport system permease subunit
MAVFIVMPLLLIMFYAFQTKNGGFSMENFEMLPGSGTRPMRAEVTVTSSCPFPLQVKVTLQTESIGNAPNSLLVTTTLAALPSRNAMLK